MTDAYEAHLTKQLRKMINRIEKILIPVNSMTVNDIGPKFENLLKNIHDGVFYRDPNSFYRISLRRKSILPNMTEPTLEMVFSNKIIDWDLLEPEIYSIITNSNNESIIPEKVRLEIETEKKIQDDVLLKLKSKGKLQSLEDRNDQSMLQGRWRKEPFPSRKYEPIPSYVMCSGLNQKESNFMMSLLDTPLHGYLGQAYNYDDQELTEEWMVTFKDQSFQASSDDVIRTQIVNLLEILTTRVQDRVCNDMGIVDKKPIDLGSRLKETPVWGIDSYTRRMIEIVISDKHPSLSADAVKHFIERKLLPAINSMQPSEAHNMSCALLFLKNDNPDSVCADLASAVLTGINEYGNDLFRIHPKGTGVICTDPDGIPPHVVVAHYLGELYPPYRWCEKLDVVQQAQQKFGLKPTLPDFYNILLERPRQDPKGYGLLYVDASRRANMGSSCSHSCNANCTSSVVAVNGRLVIALTTNRHVHYGEELTMDYYSITTSDVEWRAAICLCGMTTCRGSFLHYATQDDLQQVLNRNCGPLWRYATLLRSCSHIPMRDDDYAALDRHGLKSAVFGNDPKKWIQKYASENLKFIEYERKALPCALMRRKDGTSSEYTYSAADMDARSVMEQRIQSMVCCLSMITKVLDHQSSKLNETPVRLVLAAEAADKIWDMLSTIPTIFESYKESLAKKLFAKDFIKVENNLIGESGSSKKKSSKNKSNEKNPSESIISPAERESILSAMNAINEAIIDIRSQLLPKPSKISSLSVVRSVCLSIRENIIKLIPYKSSTARFDQLADVLVLWAYTNNFSTLTEYDAVTSEEVEVYARDLGNNIPRYQVFKPEIHSQRKLNELQGVSFDRDSFENCINQLASSKNIMGQQLAAWSENIAIDAGRQSLISTCTTEEALSPDSSCYDDMKPHSHDPDRPLSLTENQVETNDIDRLERNGYDDSREDLDENTAIIFAPIESKRKSTRRDAAILSPDEPVLMASKTYEPRFIFSQLIGWFYAGTDDKIQPPDLLGCVELPLPWQCFGEAELSYGEQQKKALLNHLRDEKSQCLPWPSVLKSSFSTKTIFIENHWNFPLYGSPSLDLALGKVDGVSKVLKELGDNENSKTKDVIDNTQFDNILPPEMPTAWVQCEIESCRKWRRVAWHVDVNSLPDYWTCSMNTWDPDNAFCSAPQDPYNPEKESTIAYNSVEEKDETSYTIGTWKDVFCVQNLIYYEAQIVAIRQSKTTGMKEAKFHFKGWSHCFDEWIEFGSDRIQPYHLFTNPVATRISDHEKWQGMKRSNTKQEKGETSKSKTTKKRKSNSSKPKSAEITKKIRPSTNGIGNMLLIGNKTYEASEYADDFDFSDGEI